MKFLLPTSVLLTSVLAQTGQLPNGIATVEPFPQVSFCQQSGLTASDGTPNTKGSCVSTPQGA